jgi:hypothetical protein
MICVRCVILLPHSLAIATPSFTCAMARATSRRKARICAV